ncbi:MAG: hypothetical protein K8H84_08750 [Sulfuricella denitrificans]|nr:hypothetical protein [Sulfuricella denitrificans]
MNCQFVSGHSVQEVERQANYAKKRGYWAQEVERVDAESGRRDHYAKCDAGIAPEMGAGISARNDGNDDW